MDGWEWVCGPMKMLPVRAVGSSKRSLSKHPVHKSVWHQKNNGPAQDVTITKPFTKCQKKMTKKSRKKGLPAPGDHGLGRLAGQAAGSRGIGGLEVLFVRRNCRRETPALAQIHSAQINKQGVGFKRVQVRDCRRETPALMDKIAHGTQI